MSDALLADYYAKRAREYERIYDKPERQQDLRLLKSALKQHCAAQDVLEVACGTGYWTRVVAEAARSVLATDVNEEVLEIARGKDFAGKTVRFLKADAFDLASLKRTILTTGLAAFWWSHLKKSELKSFLTQFHAVLSPGAQVIFIDNRFVPGSNTPLSRVDAEGNTYQKRWLENGGGFEVLKNFPTRKDVESIVNDSTLEFEWTELDYFWLASYRVKN